jgi:outer membrane immunogenic protein
MRKFLVTLSALALSAGVANAGALVTPTPEPIIPAPAPVIHTGYDWTGGYAGVGLTYGRASYGGDGRLFALSAITGDSTDPGEVDGFPNGSGWGLGGFVGYNWQNGGMVYGVEGHLSGHRMRGNLDVDDDGETDIRTDVRSIASLRGRVGVAQDRTLFFLTAGPAVANIRHNAIGIDSESRSASGFVIGVGLEHAMAGGWNLRGDLEHYRFGSRDFTTAGIDFPSVRPRVNMARVSAVFRF